MGAAAGLPATGPAADQYQILTFAGQQSTDGTLFAACQITADMLRKQQQMTDMKQCACVHTP